MSQAFHGILVAAGFAHPRPKPSESDGDGRNAPRPKSEITFHSIRYTATSLLKTAGVSEAVARDIIGHESAEISRHYTTVDEKTKRKAIKKLPELIPAK